MTDFIPTAFVTGTIAVICLVVTLLVLVAMYFVKRNDTTTAISLDDDGVKQVVKTNRPNGLANASCAPLHSLSTS